MNAYIKNDTTFTGRTRNINGTTHHEYVDYNIMGRSSLQWMSDSVYMMTQEDAASQYAAMLADDAAIEEAARIADEIKDEDGQSITAQIIELRDKGKATLENVLAALGNYAAMHEDDAPFNLGDVVMCVKEMNANLLSRKIAAL